MKTIPASQISKKIQELLNQITASHEPIQITGKETNGVLISEDDWRAVQETLYLLSIPGMRESIREGLTTPLDQTDENLDW